jgi:signal transduction histidine kinase/ligand-binding sensor domain-containing protein
MPSRLSRFILSALLLLGGLSGVFSARLAADDSAWAYRAWQTDEGLPDNSVTGLAQTGDGYLWVATYGGLLRFNGADFAPVQLPSLQGKSLRTMLLDRHGRFWLGIDTGSVICLEAETSQVFDARDGLPTERMAAMAEDGEGAIWVAYPSALCRIKDGRLTRFTQTEGWPTGFNCWVTSDAKGELWYSKGGQVGVFRGEKLVQVMPPQETVIRICGSVVPGLWICAGAHLLKYNEGRGPVECALLPTNAEPQTLFEDRAGALWIGTVADGLFRYQDGVLQKVPTSHQSIYCVSEDREDNIWVGTRGGGLNLIIPKAANLVGREQGLPFESVSSVCEDTEGTIWAASQSGILARCRAGKWEMVGPEAGWTGGAATCVAADRQGGIWVGTRDRTLRYFHDGIRGTWQRQDGLHNGSVHMIFVATNDDVWVVTGVPSHLQQLHEGKIVASLDLPGENRTIRAMAQGADGTLWIGTFEGQILRVSGNALVVERAAAGPSGRSVRALQTTPDGSLWIGYAGAGLGWLKDGKYARITTAEGLRDDFASQLLADGRGGLWIVGNHGLFQEQLPELTLAADGRNGRLRSLMFGRNEGLPNFQPYSANFPNVCRSADGRLWFATQSGLLTVHPENIHENPVPPPVLLEQVSVDDRPVALYDARSTVRTADGSGLTDLRPPTASLRIPPGHRKLEFEYAALSFASPENVQFRYRLDNFDEQWIEAGTQRSAKYPHLPAGDYRFHVLACNNAGVWSEAGAVLDIVVTPFFWQTWWFRGLVVLGFTASVVSVVRYVSFRRLRARMHQLEHLSALEKERTRIARDMHDEVGAKLTRLSLLSEMVVGHPELSLSAQEDVGEISNTARETIRSFEDIVWAINPRNDTLADLVHYLCRFAEDYFDASPVRCGFDLPADIPGFPLPTEVRHHVFLAAKEALNNVLKHARASQVRVRLVLEPAVFKIVIEDNGCGFDPVAPPKRSGGGNGLGNMRDRLAGIGGRFDCDSQPGRGTCIVFTVPIPRPPAK